MIIIDGSSDFQKDRARASKKRVLSAALLVPYRVHTVLALVYYTALQCLMSYSSTVVCVMERLFISKLPPVSGLEVFSGEIQPQVPAAPAVVSKCRSDSNLAG